MSELKSGSARIFQIIALFLFTIILPLGSWFYLKKGFDYHKSAMNELKDFGTMPTTELPVPDGVKTDVSMAGSVLQLFFLPHKAKERKQALEILDKMHKQFDDRNEVLFLIYDLKTPAGAELTIYDPMQLFIMESSAERLVQLLRTLKQPKIEMTDDRTMITGQEEITGDALSAYPYIVLVDDKSMVRNYYDYRDPQQVKRLIEHTALIMPREKQDKPKLVREREK